MTLLESVQPPQERDKLVDADKLDPQWRSVSIDIDVDHVGHFDRAHDFARAIVELWYIWRERVAHRSSADTASAVIIQPLSKVGLAQEITR